jgi:exosortase
MIAILGLAHLPILIEQGKSLWARDHYQMFPLVLIFAGILARPAVAAARTAPASASDRRIGFGLLIVDWLILTFAVLIFSPVAGSLAFWFLLVATAYATGGWPTLRAAIPALAYLLLIIPPPFALDVKLVQLLQFYTSNASSRVLDLMGVYHAINGVIIEVGDKKYEIEHACSGISSLLSVLACTLFYVFWTGAHWLRGTCLVLSSVFWVLIANVLRVVIIVFMDAQFEIDLSTDEFPFYLHTMLGILLFAMTLGLIVSTDRLFAFIGTTIDWGKRDHSVRPALRPTGAPLFNVSWGTVAIVAAAYGGLILFQAGDYGLGDSVPESKLIASYNAFSETTMPEELDGWRRATGSTAFTARDAKEALVVFGDHSRSWKYGHNGVVAVVSFDYPFPSWHDLRMCYTMTGWTIAETEQFTASSNSQFGDLACISTRLTRPVERNAHLWFGEFDLNGRPITPSDSPISAAYRWRERLKSMTRRWDSLRGKQVDPETGANSILQVQVLTETYGPLTPTERADTQKFFGAVLDHLRGKCRDALNAAAKQAS